MLTILVSIFAVFFGTSLFLQGRYHFDYDRNPWLFLTWYMLAVLCLVYWLIDDLNWMHIGVLGLFGGSYVWFIGWLHQFIPVGMTYDLETVPIVWRTMTKPTAYGAVAKVAEILLQDLVAFLLIRQMVVLGADFYLLVSVFTLTVFLIHLPGWWLYGRLYGGYFLWMSTLLSPVVVCLVSWGIWGLVSIFILHILGYVLMYSFLACKSK